MKRIATLVMLCALFLGTTAGCAWLCCDPCDDPCNQADPCNPCEPCNPCGEGPTN